MGDIFEEFQSFIKKLNTEQIEYAVCGVPRATVDIDLLVLSENLAEVWKIAEDLGYWVKGLPLSFDNGIIEIRRISKIDKE